MCNFQYHGSIILVGNRYNGRLLKINLWYLPLYLSVRYEVSGCCVCAHVIRCFLSAGINNMSYTVSSRCIRHVTPRL